MSLSSSTPVDSRVSTPYDSQDEGDAVAQAEEDEAVFEINDFSTASPWEKLIAELEKAFRGWGLADGASPPPFDEPKEMISSVNGRQYRVAFHNYPPTTSVFVSRNMERSLKDAYGDDIPPVMTEMLNVTNDFVVDAHPIQSQYGIRQFVEISPIASQYSNKIQMMEGKLLLGALGVAVSYTKATIPVFTQVNEPQRKTYLGLCAQDGVLAHFDGIYFPSLPPAYKHLSGLVDLFKGKLGTAGENAKVSISARFTYSVHNWFEDWIVMKDDSSSHLNGKNRYSSKPQLDCISVADPVRSLSLATSWPHFREDTVTETASFSELSPSTAPNWILFAQFYEPPPPGKLGESLKGFVSISRSSQTMGEILGSKAFVDDEEVAEGQSKVSSARDALEALAAKANRSTSDILGVGDVGKRLGKLGQMVEKTVEKTVASVRSSESGLTNDDLDFILQHMFVDLESWEEDKKFGHNENKFGLSGMRGVPHRSLLSLLAVSLALVIRHSGGIKAFAKLWSEFVLEIRWHWDNRKEIPRLESDQGPDFRHCLLHQKLQMINYCINRQIKWEELKKKGFLASYGSGADTSKRSTTPFSSSEDEEFYLCPEDEEGARLRLEALKKEMAASGQVPEREHSPSKQGEPQGVKEVSKTLKLLHSGEPLRVPITQEEGPMTEDMRIQREQLWTSLGDSEEAAQERARMQSLTLKSDMEAFKAANPTCVLEDFVRWHSPRDWICEEGQPAESGRLSDRMGHAGNIWQVMWKEASAIPVYRQRPLFDCTAEAEKALSYLEGLTPRELVWQLTPALLNWGLESLLGTPYVDVSVVKEQIQALSHIGKGLGYSLAEDLDRFDDIVARFAEAEVIESRCESLVRTFGAEQLDLAEELLRKGSALVIKEEHRMVLLGLFSDPKTGALAQPEKREYILRCVASRPYHDSRPVANRMTCVLSDSMFKVDGAFAEDKAAYL